MLPSLILNPTPRTLSFNETPEVLWLRIMKSKCAILKVMGQEDLELTSSIEFNSQLDWKRAWKFVDNCWRITSKDGNKTHFCCKRNHVRVHSTKRPRNTAILKKETCNAKMLVSVHGNTVIAQKSGSWDSHCHSLDLMDQLQTNSFIREYIKKESKRGYDHISIYRAFRKRFDAPKVGAKYLTNAKVAQYALFSRPAQQFDTIQALLQAKNYKFEIHQSVAGNVIVFANIDQLQQLISCGNELVLMDACGSLAGKYLAT